MERLRDIGEAAKVGVAELDAEVNVELIEGMKEDGLEESWRRVRRLWEGEAWDG